MSHSFPRACFSLSPWSGREDRAKERTNGRDTLCSHDGCFHGFPGGNLVNFSQTLWTVLSSHLGKGSGGSGSLPGRLVLEEGVRGVFFPTPLLPSVPPAGFSPESVAGEMPPSGCTSRRCGQPALGVGTPGSPLGSGGAAAGFL